MKHFISYLITIFLLTSISCSTAPKTEKKQSEVPHKGAVLAGDYPDPSVIRVGDTYWATATTSAWAPAFSLMSSPDLVNWKIVGSVFENKPEWTNGNYWAPEITKMDSGFAVYYAAKGKTHGRMCLGVATSKKVEGPYTDHGPMICQAAGSIDAMMVEDENGKKFLFWKEDGNSKKLPTPIWVQELSADGLKLVGKPVEVMRNEAAWEAHLIEGPFVFKRGNFWYMFYAADSCCTKTCNYKVGVARSRELVGPWEKNPANPIIAGNETWKCPGHGSVVADLKGQHVFLYHAYHADDSIFVGRQAIADLVTWSEDGWPSINEGKGPSNHKDGFSSVQLKNQEHLFSDDFTTEQIGAGWQWPHADRPRIELKNGMLTLAGAGSNEPMKVMVARSTTVGDYIAETAIAVSKMKPEAYAGIAVVGSPAMAAGLSYMGGNVHLWNRTAGRQSTVATASVPKSEFVHVRVIVEKGYLFKFEYSTDGKTWTQFSNEINGENFPPWDLGMRIALTAGGPTGSQGIFDNFSVRPSEEGQGKVQR